MSGMPSSPEVGISANSTAANLGAASTPTVGVIGPSSTNENPAAERRPPRKVGLLSLEAWTPLAVPLFRWLWIATMMNYVATAARDVAASPWLMAQLTIKSHNGPFFVALVTTASTLPICFFSVFAGALADLMDRRRLLIITQIWMVAVSVVLGLLTWAGWMNPWGLLGLTILLAIGTAASSPAFQAVLPELVPPSDISLAMGLNSVALNLGRAAGPALFGLIMSVFVRESTTDKIGAGVHGIAATFLLTAATFVGIIGVLYFWKRPPERAAVKGEKFWGALHAGLKYTVHSRANLAILLRVVTFIIPALALWAQFPTIAHQLKLSPKGFSFMLVCLGSGAVFGVFIMQDLQRRFSIDGAVNVCTAMFALGLILLSFIRIAWIADFVMFFLGVNWVIVPTNFNVATQVSVPAWVKGRALSMYLMVLWGSFALGAAIWGRVTVATSLPKSLFDAGILMAALLVLAKWFPLTLNRGVDLSPAYKGGRPQHPSDVSGSEAPIIPEVDFAGPVEIAVEYAVDQSRLGEFRESMRALRQQRCRNGAWNWRLEDLSTKPASGNGQSQTSARAIPHVERFCFNSGAEYARQPARMTKADLQFLEQVRTIHVGETPPRETHAPRAHGASLVDSNRLKQKALDGVDRILEECEIAYERISRRKQ